MSAINIQKNFGKKLVKILAHGIIAIGFSACIFFLAETAFGEEVIDEEILFNEFATVDTSIFSQRALELYINLGLENNSKATKTPEIYCPKTTKFISSIFERILEGNRLTKFNIVNQKIALKVSCNGSYVNPLEENAIPYSQYNYVVIPSMKLVTLAANNVDQIALIIAHEISHVVLGHTIGSLETQLAFYKRGIYFGKEIDKALAEKKEFTEKEADELSVLLLANAKFNPLNGLSIYHNLFSAIFWQEIRFDSHFLENFSKFFHLDEIEMPPYDSISNREKRMREVIKKTNYLKKLEEKVPEKVKKELLKLI